MCTPFLYLLGQIKIQFCWFLQLGDTQSTNYTSCYRLKYMNSFYPAVHYLPVYVYLLYYESHHGFVCLLVFKKQLLFVEKPFHYSKSICSWWVQVMDIWRSSIDCDQPCTTIHGMLKQKQRNKALFTFWWNRYQCFITTLFSMHWIIIFIFKAIYLILSILFLKKLNNTG